MSVPTAGGARAQLRLTEIREDISSRLWSVNAGMSSLDFNALMDQMALRQFTFEQRARDDMQAVDRRLGQGDRRSVMGLLGPSRLAAANEPGGEDPAVVACRPERSEGPACADPSLRSG